MAALMIYPNYPPKFVGETANTSSGTFMGIMSEYGNLIWKLVKAKTMATAVKEAVKRMPIERAAPAPVPQPTTTIIRRPPVAAPTPATQTIGGIPKNLLLVGAVFIALYLITGRK